MEEILNKLIIRSNDHHCHHALLMNSIHEEIEARNIQGITEEEVIRYLESKGLRRFRDANDRVIWFGIGIRSDRAADGDETPIGTEGLDEYPIRFKWHEEDPYYMYMSDYELEEGTIAICRGWEGFGTEVAVK